MDEIDRIRAFSRIYTGQLGLLSRSYLGSDLGMTEVRILHDLDSPDPVTARQVAQPLGIDEGYLSRVLAGFARRGWIERKRGHADARERPIALTEAGRAKLDTLRQASRAAIGERLAALGPAQRADLAAALDRAGRLLQPGPAGLRLRDLQPGDAGWIVSRHGELYARDEGYDASFEALVAEILAAFLRDHDPARERGWIAEGPAGERLGSIFCVAEDAGRPEVAKLRLFLVEPAARGSGLAQHMLGTCMEFARATGYRHMRLWTHESHRAAGRLYARNGFTLTASVPTRAFGQDVVDQTWERALI